MDFTGAFCQKEMGALRKNGDSMPDTTVRELIGQEGIGCQIFIHISDNTQLFKKMFKKRTVAVTL